MNVIVRVLWAAAMAAGLAAGAAGWWHDALATAEMEIGIWAESLGPGATDEWEDETNGDEQQGEIRSGGDREQGAFRTSGKTGEGAIWAESATGTAQVIVNKRSQGPTNGVGPQQKARIVAEHSGSTVMTCRMGLLRAKELSYSNHSLLLRVCVWRI